MEAKKYECSVCDRTGCPACGYLGYVVIKFTGDPDRDALLGFGRKLITDKPTDCHLCGQAFDRYDDTAIHLVDSHYWEYEYARLWLRGKIEGQAVEVKP